jgi:hypothetical protein
MKNCWRGIVNIYLTETHPLSQEPRWPMVVGVVQSPIHEYVYGLTDGRKYKSTLADYIASMSTYTLTLAFQD